jgi:hypothetical protein
MSEANSPAWRETPDLTDRTDAVLDLDDREAVLDAIDEAWRELPRVSEGRL